MFCKTDSQAALFTYVPYMQASVFRGLERLQKTLFDLHCAFLSTR